MKRKIALLLAFVMVFSLVPMTVSANQWARQFGTGLRAEPDAASGVRHINNGSIVAAPGGFNEINVAGRNYHNASPALRHILVTADYYATNPTALATYFNVQMSNAYWLGTRLNHSRIPAANQNIFPVYLDNMFVGRAFVDGGSPWNLIFTHNSTGATVSSPTPAMMAVGAALAAATSVGTAGGQFTGIVGARAGDGTVTTGSAVHVPPPYYPAPPVTSAPVAPAFSGPGFGTEAAAVANAEAQFKAAANAGRVFALSILDIPEGSVGAPTGGGDQQMVAWIEGVNATNADFRNVSNTLARVGFWRTDTTVNSYQNALRIPVEYVTVSATNTNPVTLTYAPRLGWPQPASGMVAVNLTTVADYAFRFHRQGGPRHFHSYQSVIVGGTGIADGIRIEETALGAFNRESWWVEFEIVTPGFRWAPGTVGTISNNENVNTRWGATSGLQNVNVDNVVLGPNTGNQNTQNRTLGFLLHTPNATEIGRTLNDWVAFRNLLIVANSGARAGNVDVEIRIGHPHLGTGVVGGTQWGWQWNQSNLTEISNTASNNFTPPWNIPVPGGWGVTFGQNVVGTQTSAVRIYGDWNGTSWSGFSNISTGSIAMTPGATGRFFVGTFHPQQLGTGAVGNWGFVQNTMHSGRVVAAVFGEIGLELVMHDDDDAADFELRSGMYEWARVGAVGNFWNNNFSTWNQGWGGWGNNQFAEQAWNRGDVWSDGTLNRRPNINPEYHRTARAILRETVPGSLPATGAHPTTITFEEGINILAVSISTNNAQFYNNTRSDNNIGNIVGGNYHNRYIVFDGTPAGENHLNASIHRNVLTLRPYIGTIAQARYTRAEIGMQFYLSIEPGFEHLYGAEIEMFVNSGTVAEPFEDSLVIAYAWDPIIVDTTPIVIDDIDQAAFGLVRTVGISDVDIYLTRDNVLVPGDVIWIGVEGGISRSWGRADHISIGATYVRSSNDRLVLSTPRLDSHGVYVTVLQGSSNEGDVITFGGVAISGGLLVGQSYNIFVAGNAVAANWDGFSWLQVGGAGMMLGRGATHGFFSGEPYATPAFSFEGADVGIGPGPGPGQQQPGQQQPGQQQPVARVLNQATPFNFTRDGQSQVISAPTFAMVPVPNNPAYHNAFVPVAFVEYALGWTATYGNAGQPNQWATFTRVNAQGVTEEITFTLGSVMANINGVDTPMVDQHGNQVAARLSGGRFQVPIRFFQTNLGVNLEWLGGSPGNFSLRINP